MLMTIDRRAEAVVFAAACRATPLAVSEQWTLSRARVAPPPRCALARAGPRVAPKDEHTFLSKTF